jgi:hypothetical protein
MIRKQKNTNKNHVNLDSIDLLRYLHSHEAGCEFHENIVAGARLPALFLN